MRTIRHVTYDNASRKGAYLRITQDGGPTRTLRDYNIPDAELLKLLDSNYSWRTIRSVAQSFGYWQPPARPTSRVRPRTTPQTARPMVAARPTRQTRRAKTRTTLLKRGKTTTVTELQKLSSGAYRTRAYEQLLRPFLRGGTTLQQAIAEADRTKHRYSHTLRGLGADGTLFTLRDLTGKNLEELYTTYALQFNYRPGRRIDGYKDSTRLAAVANIGKGDYRHVRNGTLLRIEVTTHYTR